MATTQTNGQLYTLDDLARDAQARRAAGNPIPDEELARLALEVTINNDPTIQRDLAQWKKTGTRPATLDDSLAAAGITLPEGAKIAADGSFSLPTGMTWVKFAIIAGAVVTGGLLAGAFTPGAIAAAAPAAPAPVAGTVLGGTETGVLASTPLTPIAGLVPGGVGTSAITTAAVTGGTAATTAGIIGTTGSIAKDIFMGLQIAGGVLGVVSQLKAGAAAKEIGDYNAKVAEQQAQDALLRGDQNEQQYRAGVRTLIGSQRAGFAAQNVDVGVGSPVDVTSDAAFLGELDALTIRTNARREAWGYQVQAQNARMGGQQAQTASQFNAAGTILGTGASLLQSRYGWGRAA